MDDGIINISYYQLTDEVGEYTDYMLAYDKRENIDEESINEWSDEYEAEKPYVLILD